jgi:polysaccharide biosynthesis protein PslJ
VIASEVAPTEDAAPDAGTRGRARLPRSMPAVGFVCAYVVLLLGVPAVLIFAPLGSPGTPANMLGMAALVWWLAATVGGLNPVRGLTTFRVCLALLVLGVLGGYASGAASGWYAPPHVRAGINDWMLMAPSIVETTQAQLSAADRGLLAVVGWVGVSLLVAEGLRSWADLDRVVSWITWVGAYMAALGLLQYTTGINIAPYYDIPGLSANWDFGSVASRSVLNRVSATASHAIEYGVVLATILPLAVHRTIHRWGERWALFPTLLIGVGATLSVSRSAVLCIVVAFLVLLAGWPNRWRLRALAVAPFAVVALRAGFPGLVGTIYSLFESLDEDPSIDGRTQDYEAVTYLVGERPLLGRGFFTFLPQYYRILDNQYLLLLIELGILGTLAVLVYLVAGLLSARAVKARALDPAHRHLGLCLSAGSAGMLLSLATFDTLAFSMAAGTLFLMLGMSFAAWRLTAEERRAREVDA